jgi:hypothetical protein
MTTLAAVDQYSRTLALQKAGLSPLRFANWAAASQFNIDAGQSLFEYVQYDLGVFAGRLAGAA